MKRLQNKIEIEYVKGSISRHNNLMKQNNGDDLCKLALNDANISDISSNKSIASTTQLNDLNLASFVKNVPVKIEQINNEQQKDLDCSLIIIEGSTSDIEDCDDLETSLNDPKIKEHNLGECSESFQEESYLINDNQDGLNDDEDQVENVFDDNHEDEIPQKQIKKLKRVRLHCQFCGEFFGDEKVLKFHVGKNT